jgi:hypothetical protein
MYGSTRTRFWLGLAIGLCVYSVICLAQVPDARRRAAAVPRMTLDELVRRQTDAFEYVNVTDLKLCSRGVAFWRDAMSPGDVDAFVPVYSATEATEPAPERLAALLEVQDGSEWERIRASDVVEVTARVRGDVSGIEAWARDHLVERYVGLRWEALSLLTVGLHEPTAEKAESLLVYGLASGISGLTMLTWLGRRRRKLTQP